MELKNLSYSSFDLESLRKSGLGHLIYEDKIWSPALLIENGKDIVGLKKGDFSPIIKRKKENDMSLILMMKNQNGLVAVSDSKSTISNGMEEEYGRNVQKIFKGNNYILGTWGVNMLHIDVTVRIEDVLKSLVERYGWRYQHEFFRLFSFWMQSCGCNRYATTKFLYQYELDRRGIKEESGVINANSY